MLGACQTWPEAVSCLDSWGVVVFLAAPGNVLLVDSAREKGPEQMVIPF